MSLTLNTLTRTLFDIFKLYPLTQKLFVFNIYHVLMRVLDKNDFGIYAEVFFFILEKIIFSSFLYSDYG